jgi:hypothetical protein
MTFESERIEDFIILPGYAPVNLVFPIEPPAIVSGYVYHFTTGSGLLYEVRFAPKANKILEMVVNFTVISDEFEHDYPVTNRGEVYSVIATVIEIIKLFHHQHNFSVSYEFSGEFKEDEDKDKENASIRSRLYLRYAGRILNNNWKPELTGNKVILRKIK